MIIRICVVDPTPRAGADDDVVVFQVPEKSRQFEILVELLNYGGYDFVEIPFERKAKKRKLPQEFYHYDNTNSSHHHYNHEVNGTDPCPDCGESTVWNDKSQVFAHCTDCGACSDPDHSSAVDP